VLYPPPPMELVDCPICHSTVHSHWASESGFTAVRCDRCRFIYLNPRPSEDVRSQATQLGAHPAMPGSDMTERYSSAKVLRYKSLLARLLRDVWAASKPVRWLDVGAGYGEVVSAVMRLAPPGSVVQGLEPMIPKVRLARERGIDLRPEFLGQQDTGHFHFVSAINVFSHVNDPRSFIGKLAATLAPGGELVLETGDMGDVEDREQFPGALDLPDHVGFATKANVESLLTECGFRVVKLYRLRIDGVALLAKSIAKRVLGRRSVIAVPYRSPYRRLVVRARLM